MEKGKKKKKAYMYLYTKLNTKSCNNMKEQHNNNK